MRDLENRPSAVDRALMKRSLGCLGRNVTIFSHQVSFGVSLEEIIIKQTLVVLKWYL